MSETEIIHEKRVRCLAKEKKIEYVHDEKAIFSDLRMAINWPLRVFNLKGMGINQEEFIKTLVPAFRNLPWDEYDARRERIALLQGAFPCAKRRLELFNRDYYPGTCDVSGIADLIVALCPEKRRELDGIMPHRKRSIARFRISPLSPLSWHIVRIPAGHFSQSQGKEDFREAVRVFQEMDRGVTEYPGFQKLLMRLGQIVEQIHGRQERLEITAHQMTTVARREKLGEGAPEGVHQDGMDYIVSALVIERKHIHGGLSFVYGSDKTTPYLHITLRPGQGIFQTDMGSPFWHSVTPISVDPNAGDDVIGERSILGFDMKIL